MKIGSNRGLLLTAVVFILVAALSVSSFLAKSRYPNTFGSKGSGESPREPSPEAQ
jgi:hypothetical protein